jgi:hypothetical protein
MKWFAVLFIMLSFSEARAQSPWPQQPPAQYNHAYRGHLIVREGTPAQIHQWCHSFFARACAMSAGNSCTIYLPLPTPGAAPEILSALRAHEVAHCNGWRHA